MYELIGKPNFFRRTVIWVIIMPIRRVFSVLKPDFLPPPFPKCYIVSSGEGNIPPSMLAHSVLPSFAFHNMYILPSLLSIFLLLYDSSFFFTDPRLRIHIKILLIPHTVRTNVKLCGRQVRSSIQLDK